MAEITLAMREEFATMMEAYITKHKLSFAEATTIMSQFIDVMVRVVQQRLNEQYEEGLE